MSKFDVSNHLRVLDHRTSRVDSNGRYIYAYAFNTMQLLNLLPIAQRVFVLQGDVLTTVTKKAVSERIQDPTKRNLVSLRAAFHFEGDVLIIDARSYKSKLF